MSASSPTGVIISGNIPSEKAQLSDGGCLVCTDDVVCEAGESDKTAVPLFVGVHEQNPRKDECYVFS